MAALQRLIAKFPTQINRENISGNRELFLSIREFLVREKGSCRPRSATSGLPRTTDINGWSVSCHNRKSANLTRSPSAQAEATTEIQSLGLAIFRLRTNSYLVCACIGKSAGGRHRLLRVRRRQSDSDHRPAVDRTGGVDNPPGFDFARQTE
jgi:hypothetical protein